MRKLVKAVALVAAVFAVSWCFASGVLSYSQPWVRKVVDVYGKGVAFFVPVKFLSCDTGEVELKGRELPGYLGKIPLGERLKVTVVTPEVKDYEQVMARILEDGTRVVVECSGMDTWHTTCPGQKALQAMRGRYLRVVVFDGGHHLPTLALRPDLIIIPATFGYAAHAYMRDAVSITTLCGIIKKERLDIPVVIVPRWGLVKTSSSLKLLTIRSLALFSYRDREANRETGQVVGYRLTRYQQAAFLYIASPKECDARRIAKMLVPEVKRIYLAINYGAVTEEQAGRLEDFLAGLGYQAVVINAPLDVKGILFREVKHELSSNRLGFKRF